MGAWTDAIGTAVGRARKPTPGQGYPPLTNTEASALILYGRDAANHGAKQGAAVPFDWYSFALPTLGWFQSGDQFGTSAAWRRRDMPANLELWGALFVLAEALDGQHVPFKRVRDLTGTTKTYDTLARDAWAKMQAESPQEAAASRAATASARDRPASTDKPAIGERRGEHDEWVWDGKKWQHDPEGHFDPTAHLDTGITLTHPHEPPVSPAAPEPKKSSSGLAVLLLLAAAALMFDSK